MDTREKILPAEDLAALLGSGQWTVTVGHFDPLTAAQAKRLHELNLPGRKLLAVVLENPQALLPAKARANLIAALRDVDAVLVAGPEGWRNLIQTNDCIHVVEDVKADEARSAEFVRYIAQRHAAAVNGRRGS